MQRYRLENEIGEGAFGTVFRAVKISTGKEVAMKRMKQEFAQWSESLALREVRCLMKLMERSRHPNIVEIYEVIRNRDHSLYLVFECMPENLLEFMQKALLRKQTNPTNCPIGEPKIRSISRQILQGIHHLHHLGYVHRDIKPENILLRGDSCKVADFGLARETSRSGLPCTDYVTTRWYRAPEVCLRSPRHDPPVDMFALGCVMAEMYNLNPLFPGKTELDQINLITKVLGVPNAQTWPEGLELAAKIPFRFMRQRQPPIPLAKEVPSASTGAVALLERLLILNPQRRISASDALGHEFFVFPRRDLDLLSFINQEHRLVSTSPQLKSENGAAQKSDDASLQLSGNERNHQEPLLMISPNTVVNPYRANQRQKLHS